MTEAPGLYELGVGSMEKLRKVPGWSHVYRPRTSSARPARSGR